MVCSSMLFKRKECDSPYVCMCVCVCVCVFVSEKIKSCELCLGVCSSIHYCSLVRKEPAPGAAADFSGIQRRSGGLRRSPPGGFLR